MGLGHTFYIKFTLLSQLMMNILGQVMHHDACVLMDSIASHFFTSSSFANTVGLKVKEDNTTLLLGNDGQVPTDRHIKILVKIE